jgi:hypothetical protein
MRVGDKFIDMDMGAWDNGYIWDEKFWEFGTRQV